MGKSQKGIEFLATYEVEKLKKEKQISHFAIPSRYRKFSVGELYKKVISLRPDYKGKYAFSYSELGWGLDIGVSIDFIELTAVGWLPFHLEVGLSGGGDKIGELVLLLSRPHQGNRRAHKNAPKELLTDSPLCLQYFIGNRYNFRLKANVGANIKIAPPLEIGKGNLAFTLAGAELSYSGGYSYYKLKDEDPGWYDSKASKLLQKDIDNVVALGLGKSLKEDVVTWIKDHVNKRIINNLRYKASHLQKNSQLKKTLNQLSESINAIPPSGFFARIKDGELHKKTSKELITIISEDNTGLEHYLNKLKIDLQTSALGDTVKNKYKRRIEEAIGTMKWYRDKLEQSKKLKIDSKTFDRLPVKLGNSVMKDAKPVYKKLSFAELSCTSPFQVQLDINLLGSLLKPGIEEEIPKAKGGNDDKSDGFQTPEFGPPVLTEVPFKLGRKLTKEMGLKDITSTIGISNLYNFSIASGRYQTYGITKQNKIIFSQDTEIKYSNLQFQLGADFWIHLEKKNHKKESIKSNYILHKDGSIKKEVTRILKNSYEDYDPKKIKDWKQLSQFMEQKLKVKKNRNVTVSGKKSNLGFQGSLSFNNNAMSYKSVSAYWIYPENQHNVKKIQLGEGSGITFGMSIQIEELNRIIELYSEENFISKINLEDIDPGIKRIVSMLRLKVETLTMFMIRLRETFENYKSEWDKMKDEGQAILIEAAFKFKKDVSVGLKTDDAKNIVSLEDLTKHEQIKQILNGGQKGNEASNDLGLKEESVRLRYRLADGLKDDFTFKLGIDVGIGIKFGYSRYKRVGNEAIQDYLVYTIPNESFYFGQFPAQFLDRSVPPVVLLPHSFPEPE